MTSKNTAFLVMAAAFSALIGQVNSRFDSLHEEPSEKEPSESAKRAMISAQEKRIRKNQKRLAQNGGKIETL